MKKDVIAYWYDAKVEERQNYKQAIYVDKLETLLVSTKAMGP